MTTGSVKTLLARTLAGDEGAWTALAGRVHAMVMATCSSLRVREGLTFLADDELAREVAVRVLDRLREHDFAALRSFAAVSERYPVSDDQHFERWLRVVVKRLRVDYLRSLPEYQRVRSGNGRELRAITLAALTDDAGADKAPADRAEVRRILEVLARPEFPADQRRALVLWLEGYDAGEVASQLQLADADSGRKLLRAARQRLRRNVAAATPLRAVKGGRR